MSHQIEHQIKDLKALRLEIAKMAGINVDEIELPFNRIHDYHLEENDSL